MKRLNPSTMVLPQLIRVANRNIEHIRATVENVESTYSGSFSARITQQIVTVHLVGPDSSHSLMVSLPRVLAICAFDETLRMLHGHQSTKKIEEGDWKYACQRRQRVDLHTLPEAVNPYIGHPLPQRERTDTSQLTQY